MRTLPQKKLQRIIDPFFTTRRDTSRIGLGLHIVDNLVTVTLRGRSVLDGTECVGTTVSIDLSRFHNRHRRVPMRR